MKKLAVFGDSWSAGSELRPTEKTFGQILAEKFDLEFVNYSQPSTGLEHLLLQVKKFISSQEFHNSTCVFFLTSRARSIRYQHGQWQELLDEKHWVELWSEELSVLRSNMVLLSLQKICDQFDLSHYYICGWEKFVTMLPGIDLDRIYDRGNTHCLNFFKILENDPTDDPRFIFYDYNHFIKPNQCHPNQKGHQMIADKLYQWIKNDPAST